MQNKIKDYVINLSLNRYFNGYQSPLNKVIETKQADIEIVSKNNESKYYSDYAIRNYQYPDYYTSISKDDLDYFIGKKPREMSVKEYNKVKKEVYQSYMTKLDKFLNQMEIDLDKDKYNIFYVRAVIHSGIGEFKISYNELPKPNSFDDCWLGYVAINKEYPLTKQHQEFIMETIKNYQDYDYEAVDLLEGVVNVVDEIKSNKTTKINKSEVNSPEIEI